MSQDSTGSVRDLLPVSCSLNLSDEDFQTLDLVEQVDVAYYNRESLFDSDSEEEENSTGLSDTACNEISYERDIDAKEVANCRTFFSEGCGCTYANGNSCSKSIGHEHIESYRLNMLEISKESLDLILLSHMQQTRMNPEQNPLTLKTKSHTKQTERKNASVTFYLFGRRVCKYTYLFSHGIGSKRYKNLCQHFDKYGVSERINKNARKIPHNAFTVDDDERAVKFIQNFAEKFAMPLPGRMPRMRDYTVMMLPSDTTKSDVWTKYVESCNEVECRHVGLTKFKNIWTTYVPDICIMQIASDLCDTCQKNNHLIMKSANATEEEKSEKLRVQEEHLAKAKECREYYRQQCNQSTEYWNMLSADDRQEPCIEGPIHVSFDYAQNLQIPHMPQQVGPIYFKTPRKCHLFGICCETLPVQVNYLIDEGSLTGKGANETVSYLDHYFKHHGIKCRTLNLHCDNCRGQNKNNTVMQYLAMRTLLGLNNEIECSFMIPYHTRFGPDWCFGLIKMKYKRAYVSSVSDLADVVLHSTNKNINVPQIVSDTQVDVRNWKPYLDCHFRKIPNMTTYQHFRFSSDHPGDVFVRTLPSSAEKKIPLLKLPVNLGEFLTPPDIIKPPGLSAERAWYLYDNIRDHCEESGKEDTCPMPDIPRPKSTKCKSRPSLEFEKKNV